MSGDNVRTQFAAAMWRAGMFIPPWPYAAWRMFRAGRGAPTGLGMILKLSAARWPHRVAVHDEHGPLSYQGLTDAVEATARSLQTVHGIGAGDPVGVMCRNGRDFVIALYAANRLGADVVLFNTEFRGSALAAVLGQQKIRIVIADDQFVDTVTATGATRADPRMRSSQGTLPIVDQEGRFILLTSGTTGTPRGVPRDPNVSQMLGMVASILDRTRIRCGTRAVVAVPFFHAFGLATLSVTLAMGGTVITRSRFDPGATVELCRRHDAHSLLVVPTMITRILDADLPEDATVPPVVLSGGSTLAPSTAQRFARRFGDVLFNGYGSSEVALATLATPADLRDRPGTVGRAVAGAQVAVVDDGGHPVAPGTSGRVFVGGAAAVGEYVGGDQKDQLDGLVSTGDVGSLDAAGRLSILGREDDMIVSGGENVYPQAVENALSGHADVVDACAFGAPDTAFGERLVMLVVPRGGLAVDNLHDYLTARVSRFERPRDIHLVDEIPRNAAGKVDRAAARSMHTRPMHTEEPS